MSDALTKNAQPLHFRAVGVAAHCTPLSGVGDPLRDFLRVRCHDLYFASHPFTYTGDRTSRLEHWRDGKQLPGRRIAVPPSLSALLRDVFANFSWFGAAPHLDIFVGIDNVNATCGIVLKWLGKTDRVVFYVIDYTKVRFRNPLANWLYHSADRFAIRFADEIWNISPRIAEVRAQIQNVDARKNMVVPNGVDPAIIPQPKDRKRHDLVVMAHLVREKGIQLAIAAMSRILARVPDCRLLVIGDGPYRPDLQRLADDLGLGDTIRFLGVLERRAMYEMLVECGVGLAPYLDDPGSISYYADPGKPKEYLACGLPVITTDVPFIASDIREGPMGLTIHYDEGELTDAAVRLMTDSEFYERCVANARLYTQGLDWEHIFARAFGLATPLNGKDLG